MKVTADRVRYEMSTGRVLLEGNAVVRRGAIVLRARSAEWDPATGEVRATGGVLLTDPTRVISAEAVRAVLGGELEAEGVVAFVKDRPVDLSALRTADEAGRTGRNRLTFSTPRLRGKSDGHLKLQDARLTLCDCPGGAAPSWEVTAREADVIPGERAILRWPVLRITPRFLLIDHPVPVLVLPWLYLPLADRKSGVLIPTFGSTGASGFSVAEPLYLTLGRSADATLTPEYAFGRARGDLRDGKPAVRGPGARLELRWAPAEHAQGMLELGWLHDLDLEPGGEGGDRFALVATHGQRLGDATSLQGALRLALDPVWVRDTTPDVLGRSLPYRRSDLLVSHRLDAVVAEAVASYDQPLDPVAVGTGAPYFPNGAPYGPLGSERGFASRFGAASATLVPLAAGPLRIAGRLGAARFGPAHAVDGALRDVEGRPAVTRADARAEVAAPLLLGGAFTLAPYVRGAALGYAPDRTDPRAVSWGVAGASLETEVARRFGGVRHVIAPRLEWRAGTRTIGDAIDVAAYDHLDRSRIGLLSASPGVFQQLRASVETRLETASATALRLELGQDADLRAGRFAEAFTALAVTAGPFTGDARARFFTFDGRPGPAPAPRIRSPLAARRAHRASRGAHRPGPPRRRRPRRLPRGRPRRLGEPRRGARPALRRARGPEPRRLGRGDARAARRHRGRAPRVRRAPPRARRLRGALRRPHRRASRRALQVQQHAASVAWESPCRCFRITMIARVTDCGDVSYSASLDLSRLGGTAFPH